MAPVVITMVLAAVVSAVVWAAAAGKLSANGMVGIRTQATQRSEGAWRAAHRAALRVVMPGSIAVLGLGAVALIALPEGWSPEPVGLVLLGVYVLVLVGGGVVAQRTARASTTA